MDQRRGGEGKATDVVAAEGRRGHAGTEGIGAPEWFGAIHRGRHQGGLDIPLPLPPAQTHWPGNVEIPKAVPGRGGLWNAFPRVRQPLPRQSQRSVTETINRPSWQGGGGGRLL